MPRFRNTLVGQNNAYGSPAVSIAAAMSDIANQWAEVSFDARAKVITEEQTAAGLAAGREAAKSGQAPTLNQDSTVAAQAFNAAAKRGYLAAAANSVRDRASQAALEHPDDPDAFAQKMAAVRSGYTSLPADMRTIVEADIDDVEHSYAQQVRAAKAKADREAHAVEELSLLDKFNTNGVQAARQGNSAATAKATSEFRTQLDGMVKARVITGAQAAARLQKYESELTEHATLGRFDDAMKAGTGAASEFIDDFKSKQHPGIAPDQYDALIRRMEATLSDRQREERAVAKEAETARRADYQWRYTRLLDDVEAGRAGAADIELFGQETGFAKPSDWKRLQDTLERRAKAAAKESAGVDGVAALMRGEEPAPDAVIDRGAVSKHFATAVKTLPQGATIDDGLQLAVDHARGAGIYPEQTTKMLSARISSGKPEDQAWAATRIARLQDQAPLAASKGFDSDTLRTATLASDYLNAGLSPRETFERMAADTKPADGVRKERERLLSESNHQRPESAWQWARTRAGLRREQGLLNRGDQELDDDESTVGLRADFLRSYRDAFLAHGNDNAAREEAARSVMARWGVSTASGDEQWLRYPPEMFYRSPDGDTSWIGDQLRADVVERLGSEPQRFSLLSDSITAQQAESGKPTTYAVQIVDQNGLINIVPNFRWQPDAAKRSARVTADRVDAGRKAQERFRSSLGPTTPDDPSVGTPTSMGLP